MTKESSSGWGKRGDQLDHLMSSLVILYTIYLLATFRCVGVSQIGRNTRPAKLVCNDTVVGFTILSKVQVISGMRCRIGCFTLIFGSITVRKGGDLGKRRFLILSNVIWFNPSLFPYSRPLLLEEILRQFVVFPRLQSSPNRMIYIAKDFLFTGVYKQEIIAVPLSSSKDSGR